MPTYNSDVLPATPYENIGSPTQPWNGYFGIVNSGIQIIVGNQKLVLQSAAAMVIDGSNVTVIEIDMVSDVLLSSFVTNITLGATQFVLFRIVQNTIGHHKFAWPANFVGGIPIDNVSFNMSANQIAQQMFLYDADSDTAMATGSATLT